jgi:hypothetical protein
MSPKRTFLDSGILMAAARGTDDTALLALQWVIAIKKILDSTSSQYPQTTSQSLLFRR